MSVEVDPQSSSLTESSDSVYKHICEILDNNAVAYALLEHKPVTTMEDAQEVCGNLPEQGVKVLFARAYTLKKQFYYVLIVWSGDTQVNFKHLANVLGIKKLSLATSDEVKQNLKVDIGALSPFGYLQSYPVVLDRTLQTQSELYINPGDHRKTLVLKASDLLAILNKSSAGCVVA